MFDILEALEKRPALRIVPEEPEPVFVAPPPAPKPQRQRAEGAVELIRDPAMNNLIKAAKNIRLELKALFPGVKFSVKSDRFSMGNSIDVSWVDGPVADEVDKVIGKYQGGHFNGMEDLYEYDRERDGSIGEAKFVHSRRELSDAKVAQIIAELREKYGDKVQGSPEDFKAGRLQNVYPIGNSEGMYHWSLQSLIHRHAEGKE
jgi:hypothetical protein